MLAMVDDRSSEQRQQRRNAYRRRRRSKSWKREQRSRADIVAETITVSTAAGLTWLFTHPAQPWPDLVLPAGAGLLALGIWEFLLRPLGHYLWTVPEDEHLDLLTEIDQIKKEHGDEIGRLNKKHDVYARNVEGLHKQIQSLQDENQKLRIEAEKTVLT